MENNKFKELGLSDAVVDAIDSLGYKNPTKIQEQIIPEIMSGNDVIGQAQTGTGKTLAFAASILSKIDVVAPGVKAIVLTPTRELALQVCDEFKTLSKNSKFELLPVYGGSSIETQIRSLKKGTDVVVGTPGRVLDLIRRKVLKIETVNFFVLDEADEMLNMGFLEDIELIFNKTSPERQVLLFSATMPNQIKKLATKYMKEDYQHIAIEEASKTSINVKQYYYLINEKTRLEAMCRVLDSKDFNATIIFCQTKREVDEVFAEMSKRNYSVEAMHGDIAQSSRIKTLDRFKKGSFKYLIATDVAARGIHVDNIECVINYNLPQDIESYIHRIGRTGRAKNEGIAISFVNHREVKFLADVEKVAKCTIRKSEMPETRDIISKKYEKIMNQIKTTVGNKEHEEYIQYVRDMNKDELIKFSAALFKALFDKEVGSDLNKDLTVASPRVQTSKNYTRVFLTIGKMDNLKKGSLLDFLKETTGIDKALFINIEILTKFTFMDVHTSVVDEFMKKVNNTKLYERVIRVEKAKAR